MNYVIDVAFVLATVAFFKEQFDLKGKQPLIVAFVTVLALAFLPDLLALYPQFQPAAEKIATVVKLFLSAPGLFDLSTNLLAKSANKPVG